jgi:hypothetical protein
MRYKYKAYWLVLTRPSMAGTHSPNDSSGRFFDAKRDELDAKAETRR